MGREESDSGSVVDPESADQVRVDPVPVDPVRADSMPADSMPADSMPADSMPANSISAVSMPTDGETTGTIFPAVVPPAQTDVAATTDTAAPELSMASQQFRGLDPELLTRSAEETGVLPSLATPQRLTRWQLLRQRWLDVRIPLLLVTAVLAAIAVPRTTAAVVAVLNQYPITGGISIILWGLYAVPLIWLVTRFDFFEREPWTLLATALAWGGLIATGMAVQANRAIYSMLTSAFGEEFTVEWGPAIAAPFTEETLKAVGIVAAILLARRRIRSAIDGFVVGAVAGVGFQVVENFIYTGNLLNPASENPEHIRDVFTVFFVRGVASGLWSHAAYSGLVGLGIGYWFTRADRTRGQRLGTALGLFALAWFLHFLWNSPILLDQVGPLAILIKGSLIVVLLLIVVLRNQGRQSYIYTEYLEAVSDPELVTKVEIEELRTYRSREDAARAAARTGGAAAADAIRVVQRGQADLSVALATGDVQRLTRARATITRGRKMIAEAAAMPPQGGHQWGLASIWLSIIGVLIPIIGPVLAAILAGIGTVRARRAGLALASSLKAAWVLAGISLVVGVGLVLLLQDSTQLTR